MLFGVLRRMPTRVCIVAKRDVTGFAPGMMLEMDNSELLILLDSEAQLKAKAGGLFQSVEPSGQVDEALKVLEQAK